MTKTTLFKIFNNGSEFTSDVSYQYDGLHKIDMNDVVQGDIKTVSQCHHCEYDDFTYCSVKQCPAAPLVISESGKYPGNVVQDNKHSQPNKERTNVPERK